VEQLRLAGDALAEVFVWGDDNTSTGDVDLAAWQEARRER
jgi:hypothetical protein